MFIATSTEQILPVMLLFGVLMAFTAIGCLLATAGMSVLNRAAGRAAQAYFLGGAGFAVGLILLLVGLAMGAPAFWLLAAGVPMAMGSTTLAVAFRHNSRNTIA